MPRLHLVRHGRPAAGWGDHADPGLDAEGARQAEAAARQLDGLTAPVPVASSPARRARETAVPLARRWSGDVAVEAAWGEIPSPSDDLHERSAWLGSALEGTWSTLDDAVARWRATLVAAARRAQGDLVVFTHFVAINAVVGQAWGRDEVTVFLPAHASITVVDVDPQGGLEVVELGGEAMPDIR